MKKLLSIILSILMVVSTVPFAFAASLVASGECGADGGDNLTWTLDSDGVLTVSGNGALPDYEWNGAPWYSYGNSVSKIVIEEGVESIGVHNFYGLDATELVLSSSVTSIGYDAFSATSLKSITFSEGLKSIGESAFFTCDIQHLNFPKSLETIHERAFWCCRELTSVTFPEGNSLSFIGESAFEECLSLSDIIIPDGDLEIAIDKYAFLECSSLKSFAVPSGVKSISNGMFSSTGLESITFHEGVTSIGDRAFQSTAFKTFHVPYYIKNIGDFAFNGMPDLTDIYFWNKDCQLKSLLFGYEPEGFFVHGYADSTAKTVADEYALTFVELNAEDCEHTGKITMVDKVDPTCEEVGYTDGKLCNFCNNFIEGHEEIPALGHDIKEEWIIEAEPDCTTAGLEAAVCSRCGSLAAQNILCDASTYPESAHNYAADSNEEFTFSYEGAKKLILEFSDDTETEKDWDFIYIYDSTGAEYGKYSGTELAGQEIELDGDSLKIKLTSDPGKQCYGFKLDSIYAVVPNPEYTKEIPALGHDIKEEWIIEAEPDCTTAGLEAAECSRCGNLAEQNILCDASTYPESAHNYAADSNEEFTFSYEGAKKLTLKFSDDTETENNWDFIYIYDRTGAEYGKYSGTELAGQEIELDGDSFKIKLTSDSGIQYYGFKLDSIHAVVLGSEYTKEIPALGHDWSNKDGVCDKCGYECEHEWGEGVLTRPVYDAVLGSKDGYYTYTCTLCGHSYTEPTKKADDTALNDASIKVTEYIDNDTLTQEAKDKIDKSYRDILKNNGNIFDEFGSVRNDLVEEDQPAINAVTAEFERIIADADEKIASGEYVKADYTEIDEAIAKIEQKLTDENITDEGKAGLEEIKKQLEEMKADGNTSEADLPELEKALEAYEEELDKGIEDGTLVEVDVKAIVDDVNKKWAEKLEAEGLLDEYEDFINNQKATDEAMATVDEINDFANSLEGTVAENAENIAKLNEMLDSLRASFENCLRGTHNFNDYEVTSPAKCEVNAIETRTCWFCGETDEREVEGTALSHSFTKYEETEAPKCGVEGKEISYCDNGCGATDERETPALEHIFLDYVSNGDATCTSDGTKTASCLNGCGATDTVADEGTMLDHTDEDGDKLCDDCGEEVYDRCDICGGKAHGDDKIQLVFCMIITIIRFVTSILKSIN